MPAKSANRSSSSQDQPIRILHLSDFHLSEKRKWDSDPVLTKLAATIHKITSDGLKPDLVAITGDIAAKGKPQDYEEAYRWINEGLCAALGPRFPRKNILIVPGNHDVDRGSVDFVAKATQDALLKGKDQAPIADLLGDPANRAVLLKRHDAYLEFANRFPGTNRDVPWWSDNRQVHGQQIHFAGFCSSWMSCSDDDQGKLLIGRWQVNSLLGNTKNASWTVALVHHPWPFLARFDSLEVEADLLRDCDLTLCGHLHQQRVRHIQDPDNAYLELTAGAGYKGSEYPNAFHLVELYPDRRIGVHFWVWHKKQWKPDRNAYLSAPDAVAEFSLEPRAVSASASASAACSADTTAYLRCLSERTSHIEIRGLLIGSGRAPRFPIDELYIPLTTTGHYPDRTEPKRTKEELPDFDARGTLRTELHEALSNRCLVIVGDPGSGKTTFLRLIAHLLCRTHLGEDIQTLQQRLGISDRPLPMLIPLADLDDHIRKSHGRNRGPVARDAPAWLHHYLATAAEENHSGLTEGFFQSQLDNGTALILLDGLDEAPTRENRESLSALVKNAATAFPGCRFVLTSRPAAYRDDVVLPGFAQAQIDALEDESIELFLTRWCEALFTDSPGEVRRHLDELLTDLRARPEIRRLARNPVMLTALAVVHWNEKRIPEQRADLYESIIWWLARARKREQDRPSTDRCVLLHQELALAMQEDPDGRQVQIDRFDAAEAIADAWEGDRQAAEAFLRDEELDSGILVGRGDQVRFWHLTFQEYLAARALADDDDRRADLFRHPKLYQPEWRETVLLLAGVLRHQGTRRVNAMFSSVLDHLGNSASLAEQAHCFGLLGAAVQDLSPLNYRPDDPRYQQIADAVLGIFDPERSRSVDINVAIEAAEALGQTGDPRFADRTRQDNWIEIPPGEFWMGCQKEDPSRPNHDPSANDNESPVHRVYLNAYRIGKYPVTVGEYQRFVDHGGYEDQQYWQAGGFGDEQEPGRWEGQLQYPNRPVADVSWYEASAYAAWSGARLPTEAEWERAARGTEGRRYPWGDEEPDASLLNYESNVGRATPVGIYPHGATPDGTLDMAGNVLEWCQGRFSDRYTNDDVRNPTEPDEATVRVIRGGCWDVSAQGCRAAYRNWLQPVFRSYFLGFRVAAVPRNHVE